MSTTRDALWNSGHDESVEVNQRALIDKVLARYSGEFTVFRELLQNSDDAASKSVEIYFETKNFLDRKSGKTTSGTETKLPDLKTALVHQWTFRNNGTLFRDEDWNRLKKIAEGNPDEEKIGAFGVGFYSLFSVTEEPLVTSGGQWMGFHWKDKKDQLFARRGLRPDATEDVWTTFEMTLREPGPIPVAVDFARFLSTSITFMAHLNEVSVFFDDKRLVQLTKEVGTSRQVSIPRGLKLSSAQGLMKVTGIKTTPLYIKAEVMNWVYTVGTEKPKPPAIDQLKPKMGGFFSSLLSGFSGTSTPQRSLTPHPAPLQEESDLLLVNQSKVELSIYTADVDVNLTKKMSVELYRSTKKNPPSKLKYQLIYTGKDEYHASKKEDENQRNAMESVFRGLRADLTGEGSARIFIGHATVQTTGLGGHMAARFIPTVERESIDLVDRNVAVWNKELLSIGGFLARSAYEVEMATIQNLWNHAAETKSLNVIADPELHLKLRNESLHTLQFFTFHGSTPSPIVSSEMMANFFGCAHSGQPLPIISSAGIQNAQDVRMPDSAFSGFLKHLPVFPEDLVPNVQLMITVLREKGMLKDISFLDVLKELRSRPLSEEEMVSCLTWWIDVSRRGHPDLLQVRAELLNAAVLTTNQDNRPLPLSNIRSFINPRSMLIPTDGPLPHHLLPPSIGRHFDTTSLLLAFPWKELTIVDWLQHISDPSVCSENVEFDINISATWSERVLHILARSWPALSQPLQLEATSSLKNTSCIPTSTGMKRPEQAYFANADVFHDLPILTLPSGAPIKAPLAKVLESLGVRKHVDLQVIFDRMIKTGDWTIADLTKYLVSVQSTLTPLEMNRLRMTPAFTKERNTTTPNPDQKKVSRYCATDLYEPLDIFRELGLPIIDWGSQYKWKGGSEEAKFLYQLGLQRFPSLTVILNLIASSQASQRALALDYLLDNFVQKYSNYNPSNFSDLAFIPAVEDGVPKMASPDEVFATSAWAILGFKVVDPNIRTDAITKLKIKLDPPTSLLISLLERSPPSTEQVARQWFELLASRISDFSGSELQHLSRLPMVPTNGGAAEASSGLRILPPNQCYFKGESNAHLRSRIFVFVDFGTVANSFLGACGVKREPSVEEIARILLSNPRKFYELGRENFLVELRNLAINRRMIDTNTIGRMKKAPILLGCRRIKRGKGGLLVEFPEVDEDDWDWEYDLLAPNSVVIANDTNALQLFGDSIFSAPQEDLLEDFYLDLGCRRLSALVKEEYNTTSEIRGDRVAFDTRTLILERLPLFLHEHTHARPLVSFSWLNDEKTFIVKSFKRLTVTKSLNFGSIRASRIQDASAVARREGRGPIQLSLAGNIQIDMYEVATSLCRLLFETPKVNDSLLFMTILSTDLKALKRRGYNVDKILRQQKAEYEAAEKMAKSQETSLVSSSRIDPTYPSTLSSGSGPSLQKESSIVLSPDDVSDQSMQAAHLGDRDVQGHRSSSHSLADGAESHNRLMRNPLDTLRRKFLQKHVQTPTPQDFDKAGLGTDHKAEPFSSDTTGLHVTSLGDIESNIDSAMRACRAETGDIVQNQSHMQIVKESLNDGYCDISGRTSDLKFIAEVRGIKVFVAQDVTMEAKQGAIIRFIDIIHKIGSLYQLPLGSINVFYDVGETIAFNRNSRIFFNLRYYEAWHDNEVQNGDSTKAYVSWYFSLAHEIAHNLVQPHNAEHEFYFSSICQKYLPGLSTLLLAST